MLRLGIATFFAFLIQEPEPNPDTLTVPPGWIKAETEHYLLLRINIV